MRNVIQVISQCVCLLNTVYSLLYATCYQGIVVLTGTETRQLFARMIVTLKKGKSFFILFRMEYLPASVSFVL